MSLTNIDGVLVLFHHPMIKNAGTLMEHVLSFTRHSRHKIWYVNTEFGMPEELASLSFKAVVLHYTLFGNYPWAIGSDFLSYLASTTCTKIAFFQDEYRFCKERFEFINRFSIDCIFTCVEEDFYGETYNKFTNVKKLVTYIPGYVSDELLGLAPHFQYPDEERKIDISYRGRDNPFYLGRASQEKREIGARFKQLASEKYPELKVDAESDEDKRIYGLNWYQFLGSSKATLGVESGSSIFDLDGTVYRGCQEAFSIKPNLTFQELYHLFLKNFEGKITYTTISPRHFEAAAFYTCQILYEGRYSGAITPDVHYICLKKDFSNFDDVVARFKDEKLRKQIANNAYEKLIASNNYTYEAFFRNSFDPVLQSYVGCTQPSSQQEELADKLHIAQSAWWNFVEQNYLSQNA